MKEEIKTRLPELDMLRGFAVLIVVFFHITMKRPEAELGFKYGVTGVDLFFIISGFVIYMSIHKIQKPIDFIINRISRLYPAYWFAVTFTFILYITVHATPISISFIWQYLCNLTMFQFYLRQPSLDGPYWTLIVELLFYIFVYIFFRYNKLKYLNISILIIVLLTVLSSLLIGNNIWFKRIIWWIPILQFLPLFLAGMTFYDIMNHKKLQLFNFIIILFCFISQSLLFFDSGRSHYVLTFIEYMFTLGFYFSCFLLLSVKGTLFFVFKPLVWLGKISYSLYLIHQFLALNTLLPLFIKSFGFWISNLFFIIPFVVAFAFCMHKYIEQPYSYKFKIWLQKILKTT